jgi:energy-coupling factor transporter ATP-binding protein EcfA2
MALTASFEIKTFTGQLNFTVTGGSSVVLIGANGAGKTRLGVRIDNVISQSGVEVHRIPAHRSLVLNPNVVPPSYEIATQRLHYGAEGGNYTNKHGHRFQGRPETILLNDFDFVLSALYAENNDISIAYRQAAVASQEARNSPPSAKMDKLIEIWGRVLPHRELVVLAGNMKTRATGGIEYSSAEMSDGERVIFYLIAQALLAKPDTILIFDEPELHVNKSILAKLWDEIETARSDCAFIYITHDVEFAGSRHAATKYALRAYRKEGGEAWDIQPIPEDSEIPDDVLATIVGSRRPVLFVEGDGSSLDSSLYRRVYAGYTVIPVGSCDQVIHTVASFAARPELHRVGCAGLVDADGRTDEEAAQLESKGIYRLPVSEVENLLLIPSVFLGLARALKFTDRDSEARLEALMERVFEKAAADLDQVSLRYTKRRIDALIKKVGLNSRDITSLEDEFRRAISQIDPSTIFNEFKSRLSAAIASRNYLEVLLFYDNKGLLSEAARQLNYQQKSLEEFVGRALRADDEAGLHIALQSSLPSVTPRN